MIIDAHQHFWRYNDREFGWIAKESLCRDFVPKDLIGELSAGAKTIAVEARQSLEETQQLLEYAEKYDFIAGITGWLDLCAMDNGCSPILNSQLSILNSSRLVAVRHVVQDEPDDEFILREDFNRGVDIVGKAGKAYEILVFQRQLKNAIKFADRHPDMRLVLDHLGKPAGALNAEWMKLIREMAKRENVWCKVSGLVTEVGKVDFAPYVETVLEAFGPKRVMWGSDWPVVTADLSYSEWFSAAKQLLPEECLGATAVKFYGIYDIIRA